MGKFELKFKSPCPIEYLHRKAKFDRTPRILGKSSVGKNRFIGTANPGIMLSIGCVGQ